MCLALMAFEPNAEFPLVLAHNRDEYWARPSLAAAFHQPEVLSGLDAEQGGTWLGVTRTGRFAFVTNFRNPALVRPGRKSRGALVADFLSGSASPAAFAEAAARDVEAYNPFNLVLGTLDEVWVLASQERSPRMLQSGVYAFSNGPIDGTASSEWPKTRRAKALYASLEPTERVAPTPLFALLADGIQPRDDELPQTGLPFELERALGPIFIALPSYGTRCASVLVADAGGNVSFTERRFSAGLGPSVFETSDFHFATKV